MKVVIVTSNVTYGKNTVCIISWIDAIFLSHYPFVAISSRQEEKKKTAEEGHGCSEGGHVEGWCGGDICGNMLSWSFIYSSIISCNTYGVSERTGSFLQEKIFQEIHMKIRNISTVIMEVSKNSAHF